MNKRVTFLNPPGVIGDDGWPSTEWTPYKRLWVEIKTNTGARLFNSDATQWQGKIVLGLRYRNDLTPEMRVNIGGKIVDGEVVGGTTHEIDSLTNDDKRNQWLTIVLKEVL